MTTFVNALWDDAAYGMRVGAAATGSDDSPDPDPKEGAEDVERDEC